ncbi:YggT family protein [Litorimonas taeanensis]|uniref:YggT family protein n=1 Tax=Litorimonas taeanensis TaxID=568099 RepID=A0A420WII9_9PROT|nr:YggT family protein [Litorimonas taeanensis]RKQ70803.1 YggT family protein [Litorimonas taeanensis]
MSPLQSIIAYFLSPAVGILQFILIVYMIFSWLIAFNVVNLRNPVMGQIFQLCRSIVEPLLNPLRRLIPSMGGFDIAFLLLFLILMWVKGYVIPLLYNAAG